MVTRLSVIMNGVSNTISMIFFAISIAGFFFMIWHPISMIAGVIVGIGISIIISKKFTGFIQHKILFYTAGMFLIAFILFMILTKGGGYSIFILLPGVVFPSLFVIALRAPQYYYHKRIN